MIGKHLGKIIRQLLLIFSILKKNKYVQLISQKLIQFVKGNILLMIPNEQKEDRYYLAVKKLSTLLRGITSNHHDDFY